MADVANQDICNKLEELRMLVEELLCAFRIVNKNAIEEGKQSILKDQTRRRIFDLCDKTHSVGQIAETVFPGKPPRSSVPAVSYHLSVLEDYGLISHINKRGQRYYYRKRS
jgi:predicted transcriptional regulator